MSKFKSFNDGYCTRCGLHRRCLQPSDFKEKGKGSKAYAWYCSSCLKSKFGIELTKQKKQELENA